MKLITKYIVLTALPMLCVAASTASLQAQSSIQPSAQENSLQLQSALKRIARNSNDSSALADAGLAALQLGDTRAAIGFLAKADQLYPRSGRVKAGLARALLLEENPFGAIRYFDDAVANGTKLRDIAGDRGLAYDLIGRSRDAQKDYKLAMKYDRSDLLLSRYAISLGISGELEAAEAAINPLLQKSDRNAWRNRAFIMAMNGKEKDANNIARQTMRKNMATAIKPFFKRMPQLTPAQKAAAVHLGHFPASENIGVDVASVQYAANTAVRGGTGADAGLIPLGQPLGEDVKKPRVLAMPDTSTRRRPGKPGTSKKPHRAIEFRDSNGRKLPASRLSRREKARLIREYERAEAKKETAKIATKLAANNSVKPKSPTAQPAVSKPVPKLASKPTPKPIKAASTQVASVIRPGFETQIASVATKPKVASPPLVSATVMRKVAVGPTPAPISKPAPAFVASPSSTPAAVTTWVSSAVTRSAPAPKPTPAGVFSPLTPAPKLTPAPIPAKAPPKQMAAVVKKPMQPISFDLANSNPPPVAAPNIAPVPAKPIQTAQVEPQRRSMADIMKSISIPDAEKKTDVVPVDLGSITPAKATPKPEPAKKVTEKEEKFEKSAIKHPKRYWVQIATGSNLKALKYDYGRMARKHGKLFSGQSGWTSPWGRTRRLVVGPFENLGGAKKFEAGFRKGGSDGFSWVSSKGTEVNKLTK